MRSVGYNDGGHLKFYWEGLEEGKQKMNNPGVSIMILTYKGPEDTE